MSWDQRFSEHITLQGDKRLVTLRDAANYIFSLPKSEYDCAEWRTAMHCLIEAADHGGPVPFARIGVMQAINRHQEHAFPA